MGPPMVRPPIVRGEKYTPVKGVFSPLAEGAVAPSDFLKRQTFCYA